MNDFPRTFLDIFYTHTSESDTRLHSPCTHYQQHPNLASPTGQPVLEITLCEPWETSLICHRHALCHFVIYLALALLQMDSDVSTFTQSHRGELPGGAQV